MAGKRTLMIGFIVDDKDARAALGRVDESVGNTGKSFSTMATGVKAALTGVAAKAVVDFSTQMLNLGIQGEQTQRRFSTVFGDMADDARAWADENNETFGLGLVNLQGMMSQVGDLLVPMGFAREEAGRMTQEIIETSDALAVWSGRDLQEVIDTIIGAMLGERERLKNLGIKISEADIQAALDAQGLSDLEGEARRAAEANATLTLIMEQSRDALQSYKEDGIDPALAAQRDLNASWEDTKQGVALKLLPALTDAGQGIVGLVEIAEPLLSLFQEDMGGALEQNETDWRDWSESVQEIDRGPLAEFLRSLESMLELVGLANEAKVTGPTFDADYDPLLVRFGPQGTRDPLDTRFGQRTGPQVPQFQPAPTSAERAEQRLINIENMRVETGVDFLDPAARRELVRSIQENLVEYGAELGDGGIR